MSSEVARPRGASKNLELEVVWLLQRGSFTVKELAEKIECHPYGLYKALKRMLEMGLVWEEKPKSFKRGIGLGLRGKEPSRWHWVWPA